MNIKKCKFSRHSKYPFQNDLYTNSQFRYITTLFSLVLLDFLSLSLSGRIKWSLSPQSILHNIMYYSNTKQIVYFIYLYFIIIVLFIYIIYKTIQTKTGKRRKTTIPLYVMCSRRKQPHSTHVRRFFFSRISADVPYTTRHIIIHTTSAFQKSIHKTRIY